MAKKSKFFELLATEVANGSTMQDAASVAGCSSTHAYHLSADPSFGNRVSELRSQATSESIGKLSRGSRVAADTLVLLMGEDFEPSIRLNASKALLSMLGPLSELGELRKRIDALESSVLQN